MNKYLISFSILLMLVACSKEQVSDDVVLKQASFSELQDFEKDDMLGAYNAFLKGCEAVGAQSGEFIGNSAVKINRADYLNVCDKAKNIMPVQFKDFVKSNFIPWLVTYKGSEEGKFTAYYEAKLNASYIQNERYKYPVYGRPYDLVEVNLSDFDATFPNKKIIGRVDDGKLIPYYTRAEINKNGIKAPVVLWADSYIDIYIMQIQGSAVAHFEDGNKVRIAFAESNGRPFKGIGSILLSKKLLEPGQASMGSIKKWLQNNPEIAVSNMDENQRYIFHRLGDPEGPVGALNIPLTAGRSLAVDKKYIPLGAMLWLETSRPEGAPLNKLVLAQDIGGAIKGAVRGDYFWGSGGDDVLEVAGKMNSSGRYFVLIPNAVETDNGKENE
jgi:membrane-bound lytic murein transglycosylase A